jgi:hypothetical protein
MGAKAICMKNTLNEKRAAVYWIAQEICRTSQIHCGSGLAREGGVSVDINAE